MDFTERTFIDDDATEAIDAEFLNAREASQKDLYRLTQSIPISNITDGDYTASSDESSYGTIIFNGSALTIPRNFIVNTIEKELYFQNYEAQSVTVKTPAGVGVIVKSGQSKQLYNDGVDITVRGNVTSAYDFELPITTVATSNTGLDYHSEPHLEYCDDGSLLCVYRRGAAHGGNEGIIAGKKSSDLGITWGSEFTIHDHASGFDTRNPALGKDIATGNLVVFSDTSDSGTITGLYHQHSTNNGITWSAATDVLSLFSDISYEVIVSFGKMVETSNGLMAIVYGLNSTTNYQWAFGLFSTDGGVTFGNRHTIYAVPQSGATYAEPFIVAIDSNRLVAIVRDNQEGARLGSYYSSDGGFTWTYYGVWITWTATTIPTAAPVSMVLIGDEVVISWAVRSPDYNLYTVRVKKDIFYRKPGLAFEIEPRRIIWRGRIELGTATNADYGYPSMLALPDIKHTVLCTWYDSQTGDGITDTDVYVTSVPRY